MSDHLDVADHAGLLPAAPATTVAGRPLSATQAATRRRLLDAARELASEGGYEAVSMRALAERAGVSPPTAYQYFTSRDHVLVEVLSDLAASTTALVTERPSRRRDPVERTVATLRRVVQRWEDEPTLSVALLRAYLSGAPELRASREGMQSSMREWVDCALGRSELPGREAVVSILEAVLLTGLVSLVMGDNSPADIGDDLERAVRLLLPAPPGS